MRHERYELAQMQSLPLAAKVSMTKRRIRDWYDGWDGQVYLSFSGGKDSTVLKHIIDDMNLDIPCVYFDTGLDFPEARAFVKKSNAIMIKPKWNFKDVLIRYGYPAISKEVSNKLEEARISYERGKTGTRTQRFFNGERKGEKYDYSRFAYLLDAPFRVSALCCDRMKKAPSKAYEKETGRKRIVALLAEESRPREMDWIERGCNAFDGKSPRSIPLAFWTEQDILQYIVQNNVEICSVYGDIRHTQNGQLPGQINLLDSIGFAEGDKLYCTGTPRTGCVFCAYGAHHDKEPTRFQRLKQTHPKHWEYCIKGGEFVNGMWQPSKDGLGMGFVLDYIGVKYE